MTDVAHRAFTLPPGRIVVPRHGRWRKGQIFPGNYHVPRLCAEATRHIEAQG